ncbi:MAG: hypothetical protein KBC84_10900, partial [Proteobacteria bacterium]|nr:hypothetical protein [Pseudomonadota bacterium]
LKPSPMDNLKFYLSKFNSSLQYQLATRADVASIFDFSVCFLTILFILILIFLIQSKLFAKYQQQISIFGLMIVVGLVSKIYLAFPLMLGGYILSSLYAEIEGSDSKLYYGIERLGAILGKLSVTAVIWVYFCIAYVCIARVLSFPELESVYPKAETDYLINNNLAFPLFADSKISEYLMYKFIDERGEPTRRLGFDAQSVSNKEDYLVAEFRNNQGYIFDKLNPKSALVLAYSTTYYLLKNNANWQLIWVNGKELIKSGETEKPKPYSWLIFKKINDSDEKQQTTN